MNKITHLIPSYKFRKTLTDCTDADYRLYRENFDNLIEHPLTLPDLVPCVNGVPVEEPKDYKRWTSHHVNAADEMEIAMECAFFHEAKANCLFEGLSIVKSSDVTYNIYYKNFICKHNTVTGSFGNMSKIEDLAKDNLPLTDKAIKEIYGR